MADSAGFFSIQDSGGGGDVGGLKGSTWGVAGCPIRCSKPEEVGVLSVRAFGVVLLFGVGFSAGIVFGTAPPFGSLLGRWDLPLSGSGVGAVVTWRPDSARIYLTDQGYSVGQTFCRSFQPENPLGTLRDEQWQFPALGIQGTKDIPQGIAWDLGRIAGLFQVGWWLGMSGVELSASADRLPGWCHCTDEDRGDLTRRVIVLAIVVFLPATGMTAKTSSLLQQEANCCPGQRLRQTLSWVIKPGAPRVPRIVVSALTSTGTVPVGVELIVGEGPVLPGDYNIGPAQPDVPLSVAGETFTP